jgi:hypothetical protein
LSVVEGSIGETSAGRAEAAEGGTEAVEGGTEAVEGGTEAVEGKKTGGSLGTVGGGKRGGSLGAKGSGLGIETGKSGIVGLRRTGTQGVLTRGGEFKLV